MIQSEEQKEKRMKTKGTYGRPSRRSISTFSPREVRERTRKHIQRNNGQKLPKSGVLNVHPDPRSQRIQKEQSKEIHTKIHYQIVKKDKEF